MSRETLSLFLLAFLLRYSTLGQEVPACDSPVYCKGTLLDTIQRRALYDSKDFVDMSLKYDPEIVVVNFLELPRNATDQQLRQFVEANFNSGTSDISPWLPPDWVEKPAFVSSIEDSELRQWALNLTAIWRQLGRQLSPDVHANPQRHSLIPVPNPFIVAGGRFSEYYYWDSYWIVRGLLLCEMYDTARGMIENMADLIDRFGMVPNGGRVYYSRRSQPPLLTQMVAAYYNATGNESFVEEMLPALEMEYQFWQDNRSVVLEPMGYEANRYATSTNQPRPESYLADINTKAVSDDLACSQLFANLASGAESGWDFSSRWLATEGPMAHQLASIRTTSIIPVDLNAILCSNEATLSWLHNITGNSSAAEYYDELWQMREETFDEIFWNETSGTWRDYDITASRHLDDFYLSSLAPLVWGCGPSNTSKQLSTLSYLENEGFLNYPGGIPTSKVPSGQQWDFPNAWPPLQWMLIYGLSQGSHERLKMAAKEATQKWINANWIGWKLNNSMFEKYDSERPGVPGSGGEYIVQSGFGWTNGVILELLSLYGTSLSAPSLPNDNNVTTTSSGVKRNSSVVWIAPIAVLVPLVLLTVVCIIWGRWVYNHGKKRYWQRVQNEHLMAYGTAEDSGQAYNIGELYENKCFEFEHEECNKIHDATIKGNDTLPRQNSDIGKMQCEESDDDGAAKESTTPTNAAAAVTLRTIQQEDSGILSNGTSDNVSDSTAVYKNEEKIDITSLQEASDRIVLSNDRHSEQSEDFDHQDLSQVAHESVADKILTTDV